MNKRNTTANVRATRVKGGGGSGDFKESGLSPGKKAQTKGKWSRMSQPKSMCETTRFASFDAPDPQTPRPFARTHCGHSLPFAGFVRTGILATGPGKLDYLVPGTSSPDPAFIRRSFVGEAFAFVRLNHFITVY
jgi:hypothetical protein